MTVDLIVGGASKSGTTAIYDMLRQNPAFFLPACKELHYFARPFLKNTTAGPGDAAVLEEIPATFEAYLSNYLGKRPNQVAVDVSPSYLFHNGAAAQIARDLPGVKIVFLLRRPEDKIFSQYVHLCGEGRETLTFEEALEREGARKAEGFADMWLYSESGYYADAIAAFYDALGADRVRVFFFDEFRRNPEAVLKEVCLFAGLDGTQSFNTDLKSNVSGAPRSVFLARLMAPNSFTNFLRRTIPLQIGQNLRRILRGLNTGKKPEIANQTREKLSALYDDDIAKLEMLIGRSSGWRSCTDR